MANELFGVQLDERQQLEAELVNRVNADPAFHQTMLSDPKAALAQLGIRAPDDVTIEIHEETPTALHLVLPPAGTSEGGVTDEALAGAAGGAAAPRGHISEWFRRPDRPLPVRERLIGEGGNS